MSTRASPPIPQACAIPYRVHAGRIEVCLITTMKKRRWVFPKGFIEPGETAPETALKEAWEEAGLRGRIVSDVLGAYEHHKPNVRLTVACFLMCVDGWSDRWQESTLRNRAWHSLDEARATLDHDGLRQMLAAAERLLLSRASQAG